MKWLRWNMEVEVLKLNGVDLVNFDRIRIDIIPKIITTRNMNGKI